MAALIATIVCLVIIGLIVAVVFSVSKSDSDGSYHSRGTSAKPRSELRYSKDLTDIRGEQGEQDVFYYLEQYVIGKDDTLLPTLLLETHNGSQTEVDMVILSLKGVFCIEVKNWIGEIRGDDYDENWIQIYNDETVPNKTHRNPVRQNEKHCDIMEKLIGSQYKIFNIVLFKELEYPESIISNKVFDLSSFRKYFFSLPENVLTNDDLDDIHAILKDFEASEEELNAYRQALKNKYYNK